MKTKIAVIGLGGIAYSHHIPSIGQSNDWQLAATVSHSSRVDGIENYSSIETLLEARPDIQVMSLCMPPAPRFNIARAAIQNGRHVMLEKPPGATVSECTILQHMAVAAKVSLFATWHSREASMLDECQVWLADKQVRSFEIKWKEDVRRWHPGQEWIWEPGGLGVFDPGINALSILTKILPESLRVTEAILESPSNKQTPIAATLRMITNSGATGIANFDWRQSGEEIWEIRIDTDGGVLQLEAGGAIVTINGERRISTQDKDTLAHEYPRLYRKMHELIIDSSSDCDLTPLELVADAFMLAQHNIAPAFEI